MAGTSLFDIDYPRVLVLGLTAVLLGTLVYAASTSGAAFGAYNSQWDGTSSIRSQADTMGKDVRVIRNTTTYTTTPGNDTVSFVLSPETTYTEREATRMQEFVRAGGTLVVAADAASAATGNQLLTALSVSPRFENATVRDEQHNYRSDALPVATDPRNHTLTDGIESLTLNYGTTLRPGNGTVLVNSSGYAYLDRDGSESITGDESLRQRPVVAAESVENGTVLVVSDPSIFINTMLERSGNERFLENILDTHQRVALDYSHSGSLPPLVAGLLTVRQTPVLQFLLGSLALGLIAARGRGIPTRLAGLLRVRDSDSASSASELENGVETPASASDIATYLRNEHPDWDEQRIQRIAESAADDWQQ